MRRNLSIYLDIVRIFAAFGVVLSHAANLILPSIPKYIAYNGPECVAVFFVLSGLVIRFVSVEKGEVGPRVYTVARLSRIVPVAFLAIAVGILADLIGQHFAPLVYHSLGKDAPELNVISIISSCLFFNESWFNHFTVGSNEPYWSLGFEVPYYIFFGLFLFTRGGVRIFSIIAWSVIYGPKVVIYLPIWLLGVLTYEVIRSRRNFRGQFWVGLALFFSSLTLYILVKFKSHLPFFRIYEPLSPKDLVGGALYYLSIGIACSMNFIAVDLIAKDEKVISLAVEKGIRWVAGGSFTLYLVHLPIMIMVYALFPQAKESVRAGLVALFAIVIVSYLCAEVAERRKRAMRRFFDKFITRTTLAEV